MPRSLRLLIAVSGALALLGGPAAADGPRSGDPALVGSPLLVVDGSGRVTLVARFEAPLPLRAAGRPAGHGRIDRQRARLRALGRPARACVAAVAARDGGRAEPPRPLHVGRTYSVRISRTPGDARPVVVRVVLRAAREGDTRGEPLGCA